VLSFQAQAQTVNIITTTSGQSTSNNLSFSHNAGSGANRLVLVAVTLGRQTGIDGVPLYGGVPMIFEGRERITSGSGPRNTVYIYSLVNPPTGAQSITVNVEDDEGNANGVVAGAVSFSGVNTSDPLGPFVGTSDDNDNSVSLSVSTEPNAIVFSALSRTYDQSPTLGVGQVQRWDLETSNSEDDAKGTASTKAISSGTSTSITYGNLDDERYALAAVSVRPNPCPTSVTNTTSTASINEQTSKILSATPAGGTFSIVSGGGSISGNTYTAPNVSTNTSVTIRYTLAQTGCSTLTDDVTFTVLNQCATVVTNNTSSFDLVSGGTRTLEAFPTGGLFSIVSGGGSISGNTYTAPTVTSNVTVTIRYALAEAGCPTLTDDVSFVVSLNPVNTGQANCFQPQEFINTVDAWYTFTTNADDSVNTNDPVAENNMSYIPAANGRGNAASFNGTSSSIQYNNGSFLEDAFTDWNFSAWINPTDVSGSRVILDEGGSGNGIVLWIDNGTLTLTIKTGADITTLTHPTPVIANTWQYVAGRYRGSNGDLRLFINNQNVSTTAFTGGIPSHGNDGGLGQRFGNSADANITSSAFYSGLMDDVRYKLNTNWSLADIQAEATTCALLAPFDCSPNPLVSFAASANDPVNFNFLNLEDPTQVIESITPEFADNFNSIALNTNDFLVYMLVRQQLDPNSPFVDNEMAVMDRNGKMTSQGVPTYDPSDTNPNYTDWNDARPNSAGVLDPATSTYYIFGRRSPKSLLRLDLITNRFTDVTLNGATTDDGVDLAFSNVTNLLYFARGGFIYTLDPANGTTALVTLDPNSDPLAGGNIGGAWSDASGNLYLYQSNAGTIYQLNPTTNLLTILGTGSAYGSFDATACQPPALIKEASLKTAQPGDSYTYDFTINNNLRNAVQVNFFDELELAGLTFSGPLSPANPGGGSVIDATSTVIDIRNITIPANGSLTFSRPVTVDAATTNINLYNQAKLEFTGININSTNPEGNNITLVDLDTDRDGIPNIDDLDDDNDGILDTGERNVNAYIEFTAANLGLGNNETDVSGSTDISNLYGLSPGSVLLTYNNVSTSPSGDFRVLQGDLTQPQFKIASTSNIGIKLSFENTIDTDGDFVGFASKTGNRYAFTGSLNTNFTDSFNSSLNQYRVTRNDPASNTAGNIEWESSDFYSSYIFTLNTRDNSSNYSLFLRVLNDLDSDGFEANLDLDADDDGIPDNVEAQTTVGYIVPDGTIDTDGVDTAYTGGLTPIDTEGDGTPDYLDDDSDDDSLSDLDESFAVTPVPSNGVGVNGLSDDAEPDDEFGPDTVNGNAYVNTTSTFNLLDTDNDITTGGDYDYRDLNEAVNLFGTRIISALQNGTLTPIKIDAYLNIVSNNWGVVITRVNDVSTITNAVEGMLVFDTNDNTFKVCTDDVTVTWRALGN